MDRTKVFIPQGSIIGMMLEIPNHQIIVHSTAFRWYRPARYLLVGRLKTSTSVQLDKTNSDSQQVDTTIKEWVATVSDEELQPLLRPFFGTIIDAGISSINDLSSLKAPWNTFIISSSKLNLSPRRKGNHGTPPTQLLIDTRYQAWKNR